MAEAAKDGRPAPVTALTDEYSTTVANPNGSMTTTYSSSPDRVRRNNTWVPVDTNLVRRKDGSYAPAASLADVSFGGGGNTDLVTLKNGPDALHFSWRNRLPEPAVSGDSATYAEVLPGVDLRVTASATGYSSIFVVKTAQAAANADVQQLQLGLTGSHVKITQQPSGAQATDALSGGKVFQAGTALMWDSSPAEPAAAPAAAKSGAQEPGGHRAEVKIGIGSGRQTLTLDRNLLTAKTTRFPVYVDPDWSAWTGNPSQMHWARISNNGWNVYNSTATSGANSARIGLDDWPKDGGEGEVARTYYQMNTSGIKGATVQSAYLYLTDRWAASCSNTAAVVYAAGSISGWDSSHLSWSKQPSRGALQDTQNSEELGCDSSKPHVTPASLKFTVTSQIKSAAASKANSQNFLVAAKSESDKFSWKQLGYKGGARLSVTYSYRPTLDPDNGKQHVFPSATDQGRTVTTTSTPTLSWTASNKFPNGVVRNLMVDYHVLDKTGKLVAYGYGPGADKYSLHGTSWTVTPKLPDGDYTWIVSAKNQDGLWASAWSAPHKFTVDTKAPRQPTVKSSMFPPNVAGGKYSDQGTFVLSNDRTDDVAGYLFTLDFDLSDITYTPGGQTPWRTTAPLQQYLLYYATADNGSGTGTAVVNGSAAITFAPGTAGPHRLFVKAVDQGGSTSPETTYAFNVGSSTPIFAYGDKMATGSTARNDDGTTTVVPAATTTSTTGGIITQKTAAGYYFADGYQIMLANKSSTSKVANGDAMTVSFDLPRAGAWDIGANLMTASDYGIYSLTFDQGRATQATLLPSFDAYSSPNVTQYRDLGVINDSAGAPLQLAQGLHTLTLKLLGTNPKSGGFQAGIDVLRLARQYTCSLADTTDCLNNVAISTHTGSPPTLTPADGDGWGHSFEAEDLTRAGWTPGSTINVDGAAIKLPAKFGDGSNDNMLAAGQYISVPSTGVVNKGNALVFVGWSTNGTTIGATGRITYAPGSGCSQSSQAYTVTEVSDWGAAGFDDVVLETPRRNPLGPGNIGLHITAASVPLVCPGSAVSSISLPLVTDSVNRYTIGFHVLGLGIRPTSNAGGDRWVGSWSAAQDTNDVQQEIGGVLTDAPVTNQTLRIPAHLSIGSGSGSHRIRVHLSNQQLGASTTAVKIDSASVALQADGAGAVAAPVRLTFAGSESATMVPGTDVISDPAGLDVPDHGTVLISLRVSGTYRAMAGHDLGRQPVYVSAPGDSTDYTLTADGAPFTRSPMNGIPFLSGVDVTTSATEPAGAIVLYGDQTINSNTASDDGQSRFSDDLATALSTDDTGTVLPMRAGVLNQGGAKSIVPYSSVPLPLNAHGVVDRELLAQTNARIALLSLGSDDLLTCVDEPADCVQIFEGRLIAMTSEVQQYSADDALNYAVGLPTPTRTMKVYVATLPPFAASHTADQESTRRAVNAWILGTDGAAPANGYADGVIDFAAAVSSDGTATGETVKADDLTGGQPNDVYYQDLATQYVHDSDSEDGVAGDGTPVSDPQADPVAAWEFNEGSGTTAVDTSAAGTGTPQQPAPHDATLTDVKWNPGRHVETVAGGFNGTSSRADTELPLNTGKSFTVSAWVRPADTSADRTVFAKLSAGIPSLTLQYRKADNVWLAEMPSAASGDAVTMYDAVSVSAVKPGVWTQLAADYDADLNRLTLYVNGVPEGSVDDVHPFNDPDSGAGIGHSGSSWFSGDLANVHVWVRATTDQEMETEASARYPMLDWQFEDTGNTTGATDDSGYGADGGFSGGVVWTDAGHPTPGQDTGGIDDDRGALTLDGTGAVTTRSRVRTDQSFTVAAWVRLTSGAADATVLSQAGTHSSGFQLKYAASGKCWQFVLPGSDGTNPATTVAADVNPAAIGTWTHLAGVYDATTGQATLYVNGTPATPAAGSATPWNAAGQFTAGRAHWNDTDTQSFTGSLDDVWAFQGALDTDNVNALMQDLPLNAG